MILLRNNIMGSNNQNNDFDLLAPLNINTNDYSGKNNHGINMNNVLITSEGAVFNGINQWIDFGKNLNLNGSDLSVGIKFKPNVKAGSTGLFGCSFYGSITDRYAVMVNNNKVHTITQGKIGNIEHLNNVVRNDWTSVILIFDKNLHKVYVNKELIYTSTTYQFTNNPLITFCLGGYISPNKNTPQPGYYYSGIVKDLFVARRVLTIDEINNI